MILRALSLLALAPCALAADLLVGPGDSIQAAIDAALPGDRVLVSAGTYVETLVFGSTPIAVVGVDGAGATVLDGGGVGPVVRFDAASSSDTRLAGFTLLGGSSTTSAGGVVVPSGARPTIRDCVIRGNVGRFGGGVTGSPILERCAILDNTSSLTPGGGVYGAPTMRACVVAGNSATSADGGGLYLVGGDGTASIVDSTIVGNRSILGDGGRGGGIYVDSSVDAVIEGCVIADNLAAGGVFGSSGGGVHVEAPFTTLRRCTLVGNGLSSSATTGGAVYGPAKLIDCIVRDNAANQLVNTSIVTFCDVEGGWPGLGNIDADPLFVDAASGDLNLLAGSPCLGRASDGGHIGALGHASLYVAPPTDGLPNPPELATGLGGERVDVRLLGDPTEAGRTYALLIGASGDAPPTPLGSTQVPLVFDAATSLALGLLGTPVLPGAFGQLDGDGRASAALVLPAGLDAALVGSELTLAWITTAPIDTASDPLKVTVVP